MVDHDNRCFEGANGKVRCLKCSAASTTVEVDHLEVFASVCVCVRKSEGKNAQVRELQMSADYAFVNALLWS